MFVLLLSTNATDSHSRPPLPAPEQHDVECSCFRFTRARASTHFAKRIYCLRLLTPLYTSRRIAFQGVPPDAIAGYKAGMENATNDKDKNAKL
jgi:hypothetical protein